MSSIADRMAELGVSCEALDWLRETGYDAQRAWEACERADWMLWACARLGVDRRLLVTAACRCWRAEAQQFVAEGELHSLRAVETAEAWIRGEATEEECESAAWSAAWSAWSAESTMSAWSAWSAAMSAARIARSASWSTMSAWSADEIAESAARSARSARSARRAALARMASIVREVIPWEVVEAVLGE